MDIKKQEAVNAFEELLAILIRLRGPQGCPWDRRQTEKSMAPLILEEAYEATEAIMRGEQDNVAEELGDLSMNVVMTSLIAEERGGFELSEMFKRISRKLVKRHPHVFEKDGSRAIDEKEVLGRWEVIKQGERLEKKQDSSCVAGVPKSMPALLRAVRLLQKLKRTGLDLPLLQYRDGGSIGASTVLPFRKNGSKQQQDFEQEAGETLLGQVIACVEGGINPELCLIKQLDSMEKAFRHMEKELGGRLFHVSREEIARLWREGMEGV